MNDAHHIKRTTLRLLGIMLTLPLPLLRLLVLLRLPLILILLLASRLQLRLLLVTRLLRSSFLLLPSDVGPLHFSSLTPIMLTCVIKITLCVPVLPARNSMDRALEHGRSRPRLVRNPFRTAPNSERAPALGVPTTGSGQGRRLGQGRSRQHEPAFKAEPRMIRRSCRGPRTSTSLVRAKPS